MPNLWKRNAQWTLQLLWILRYLRDFILQREWSK